MIPFPVLEDNLALVESLLELTGCQKGHESNTLTEFFSSRCQTFLLVATTVFALEGTLSLSFSTKGRGIENKDSKRRLIGVLSQQKSLSVQL